MTRSQWPQPVTIESEIFSRIFALQTGMAA
jgi:hypothetical protein